MTIKKKRKVYERPPSKYHIDPYPWDMTVQEALGYTVEQYKEKVTPEQARIAHSDKGLHHRSIECNVVSTNHLLPRITHPSPSIHIIAPLYAVSWGWNASKRLGNATDVEVREPNMVQRSIKQRYTTPTCGKHHSVLNGEDGAVYTFGEGHGGELGIGSIFTDTLAHTLGSNNLIQSFPRRTSSTGEVRQSRYFKRDMKIIDIGGGSGFSISREMSPAEAMHLCRGLEKLRDRVKELLLELPDNEGIKRTWSIIRHEEFLCGRGARGLLCAWGHGDSGELGMERFIRIITHPTPITRLKQTCMTQIAVGASHVLAIDSQARIYSWGHGGCGRLGHGDFEPRFFPTLIEHLDEYYAEQCSAGDAHSGVLTTTRKAQRDIQTKRVMTFGRNGHGRLGNGGTNNSNLPVNVQKFPPSFLGAKPRQICCGGAHTLLLFEKKVPKTRANPWAIETYVSCWGYGANGQLGTGYSNHELLPRKCRIPKWEIICEVSAGRSWSMARSISGELFTWGKGLRGQLGQGAVKFSVAPVKLDTFASFVKLSSGYGHNLCVATQKTFLNAKIAETAIGVEDPIAPLITPALEALECISAKSFNCCKSENLAHKDHLRYSCLDCQLHYICHTCSLLCHRKHRLCLELPPEKEAEEEVVVAKKDRKEMSAYERITEGSGNFRERKQPTTSSSSTASPEIDYKPKIIEEITRFRHDVQWQKPIKVPEEAKPRAVVFSKRGDKEYPVLEPHRTRYPRYIYPQHPPTRQEAVHNK